MTVDETLIKDFEAVCRRHIETAGLLHRNAPVVVALSGGADSVALLAVLSRLGYDCRAAHCNFHLRGEESMRDMRHCRQVCETLDIDLYVRDFDVEEYRRTHPGNSVEMACRELRYKWFEDLLDRESAQAVAVGHHSDDRVETFFLNLMRGAGITGLTSMNARSGNVIRPLLPFTRTETEAYVTALGLGFISDSSNASDAHRRNRLRNKVLPVLEELFPGASDSVLRSISHLEAARTIYNEAIEENRRRYISGHEIAIRELAETEIEAPTVLFEMLRHLNFTYTQVCDMLECASSSGAVFRSTDGMTVAEISHGRLELVDAGRHKLGPKECHTVNPKHDIAEPIHINISRHHVADFSSEKFSASSAFFDAAALDGDARWELRHYRRGDRIVPFGAHKSKLVSDIFASARLSASQKRETWLLTRNDQIVWILGLRNSAHFAVGPQTRTYIRMQLAEN